MSKICIHYKDGFCECRQSRLYQDICDIDPELCMEDGVELIESEKTNG